MPKIQPRKLSYGEQQELKRIQALHKKKQAAHTGKTPQPGSRRFNSNGMIPARQTLLSGWTPDN